MREDKSVVAGAMAYGVVAGAAVNNVAMGAVDLTGVISGGAMQIIMAGDQGWDENGDFVCSKFIFNFRDRKVFDGTDTYKIDDVTNVAYDGAIVTMTISGKAGMVRRGVGLVERSEVILRMFQAMWSNEEMLPEGNRLKPLSVRRNQIKPGTLFRFACRSLFFGYILMFFADLLFFGIRAHIFMYELWALVIFFGSIAHRKLQRGPLPSWAPATPTPSKIGKKTGSVSLALAVLFAAMLPINVSGFKSGYDHDYAVEACDSYYFYPTLVQLAMPYKWWCDANLSEVIRYRNTKIQQHIDAINKAN
jgi:hypothetical protein